MRGVCQTQGVVCARHRERHAVSDECDNGARSTHTHLLHVGGTAASVVHEGLLQHTQSVRGGDGESDIELWRNTPLHALHGWAHRPPLHSPTAPQTPSTASPTACTRRARPCPCRRHVRAPFPPLGRSRSAAVGKRRRGRKGIITSCCEISRLSSGVATCSYPVSAVAASLGSESSKLAHRVNVDDRFGQQRRQRCRAISCRGTRARSRRE